jgi:hypothetical protein
MFSMPEGIKPIAKSIDTGGKEVYSLPQLRVCILGEINIQSATANSVYTGGNKSTSK